MGRCYAVVGWFEIDFSNSWGRIMRNKILVVDYCRESRDLMVGSLQRRGYRVISALDGNDALAQFDRDIPDLLITDLAMLGTDDYVLCQRVRETWSVPIVVMLASGPRERSTDLVALLSEVERLLKVSSTQTVCWQEGKSG